MRNMTLSKLALVLLAGLSQPVFAAYPTGTGTNYVTTIDVATYGRVGSITFNDWGYKGPNGASVNDFVVPGTTGFDASNVGQRQKVVTKGAYQDAATGAWVNNLDGSTPDPLAARVKRDDNSGAFKNVNMDGQVNFYEWGYTTPAGSTFNNMKIDRTGNYFIAKNDMKFGFYDVFQTSNAFNPADGTTGLQTYDTAINFQPYAVSDAKGWCGSVLSSNPNGLEKMAGQVTFDVVFDVSLMNRHPGVGVPAAASQIIPGFVMRSYGDYVVNMGSALETYTGNAVINNTNPLTGVVDAAYQNKVSFLGGGVIPKGVWVTADSYNADGTKKLNLDGTWNLTVAPGTEKTCNTSALRADGARCWLNDFGGYGFLLRADGTRELFEINPIGHSVYTATDSAAYASIGQAAPVPVPAAAWLLGSGLIGLVGVARGRKNI